MKKSNKKKLTKDQTPPNGKNSDLKIKSNTQGYGALVYACIGNYKGLGRQRVILHEVELDGNGGYCYGHKRTWNFPVK